MDADLFPGFPVLVVDDEKNYLNSINFNLPANGITNVECCQDSLEVIPRLKKNKYSVILLDLLMPGISGDELLLKIVEKYPDIPVIVVTAAFPKKIEIHESQIAIDCMKNGAFDCLKKPIEVKDLIRTIRDALNLKGSHEEIISLKRSLFSDAGKKPENFLEIITTRSKKMFSVFQIISLLSFTSRPLLIRGETGTGKKIMAREIHKLSRRKGEFVTFSTAGLGDDSLLEGLFGKKVENPSTAEIYKGGILEEASEGTLYLDDVGDLSPKSQEKLLHLLQKREYFPQGSEKPVASDTRVIAATQKNLTGLTQMGFFREDLDFLLKTHEIYIPPLRERKEDIRLLVDYFVKEAAENIGIKEPSIPKTLNDILEQYDFPGNINELKKMVHEAVRRNEKGFLLVDVFTEKIKNYTFVSSTGIEIPTNKKVIFDKDLPTFAEMEAIYMDEVMRRTVGDQTLAARLAGLNLRAFADRLRRIRKSQRKEKRR